MPHAGPVGTLERTFASRVALCLWRMGRVAAYETSVTAAGLEEVGEPPQRDTAPARSILAHEFGDPGELERLLRELQLKRSDPNTWERALRLLEQLRRLPDDTPVAGGASRGCCKTSAAPCRKPQGSPPTWQMETSSPASACPGTNFTTRGHGVAGPPAWFAG